MPIKRFDGRCGATPGPTQSASLAERLLDGGDAGSFAEAVEALF